MSFHNPAVYVSDHHAVRTIGEAFARGARIPCHHVSQRFHGGDIVSFGDNLGLRKHIQAAIEAGRNWIFIDHGYFKRGHFDGYYRVTVNKRSVSHIDATADPARWHALGLSISPWDTTGTYILVCPPTSSHAAALGIAAKTWLLETVFELKCNTDRPLLVREKPSRVIPGEFQAALRDVWAVVACSSNAAVEAVLAGIAAFSTHVCGATPVSLSDLSRIDTPYYPDNRLQWAYTLANNQWTLDEMSNGTCWRALHA